MKKQNYSLHIFSLCFLFVIGGAILSSWYYESSLFTLLAATFFSLLALCFSTVLLNRGQKYKLAYFVFALIVFCAALYGAIDTFIDLFCFFGTIVFSKTNAILLLSALLFIIFFFAYSSDFAILKYGLFVAFFCVTIILICFFGGIKSFDLFYLRELLKPNFESKSFIKLVLPNLILPVFVNNVSPRAKSSFLGIAAGFVGCAVCFLQAALTFGNMDINFSYLHAVGVLSSGSLFTRLDGLAYFLIFAGCVVRIAICVKAIITIFSQSK